MKNKIIKVIGLSFALIGSIFSFSSCGGNNKAFITFGTYIDQDVREFETFQQMKDLMNLSKESFLVTVYPTNGCSCWTEFNAVLSKFVKEKHVLAYSISENLIKTAEDKMGFEYSDSAPIFYVVKKGSIYQKVDYYSGSTTPFAHYDQFIKLYEQYCEYPTIKLVDKEYFNTHKNEQENLILHIFRTSCPDCQSALVNVLTPKNEANKFTTTTWAIDCESFYKDETTYTAFKNDMLMTPSASSSFGYSNGRVPTTQYYLNGQLTDANVFFNDFVNKDQNNNYYISDSFFTEERQSSIHYTNTVIKGINVPSDYVVEYQGQYYITNDDFVLQYHKPAFEAFINMYAYL